MDFVISNWYLVLLGAVVVMVLVLDLLNIKKFTLENLVHMLVVLLASWALAWIAATYEAAKRNRADVDFFLQQISVQSSANTPYTLEILSDLRKELMNFRHRTLEASSQTAVRFQIERALLSTSKTASFLDNYILLWNQQPISDPDFEAAAIRRGVVVDRLFVLSDGLMHDRQQLRLGKEIMDRQVKAGIRVRYVLQSSIEKDPRYGPYAYVDYALLDDKILVKIAARASAIAAPEYGQVFWDPDLIRSDSPFPWIASLVSAHRYSFNSEIAIDSNRKP